MRNRENVTIKKMLTLACECNVLLWWQKLGTFIDRKAVGVTFFENENPLQEVEKPWRLSPADLGTFSRWP